MSLASMRRVEVFLNAINQQDTINRKLRIVERNVEKLFRNSPSPHRHKVLQNFCFPSFLGVFFFALIFPLWADAIPVIKSMPK